MSFSGAWTRRADRFPYGFYHAADRPRATRAVMEHNLIWFNHWLWGEELGDDWPGESWPQTC